MTLWIQGAFPVAEARLHNCLAQEHRRSVLAVPQEVHINPDLGTFGSQHSAKLQISRCESPTDVWS